MLKSLFIIFIIIFGNAQFGVANNKKLITVSQFVNHPALDAGFNGIKQALTDRKILPNQAEIKLANAQGNIASSVQIATYQASLEPDIMVAIATPSAQSVFKAKGSRALFAFVAVTDPKSAGFVADANVIGVSDNPPIYELLEITLKILPKIKAIGVIYNAGEINSVKMLSKLEEIAKLKDIQVIKTAISSSSDIKLATQKLIGTVDIIYVPQDNIVVSAIDSVIQLSLRAKVPVIANDPSLVKKDVFLALGCDYFKSGVQLGGMIADFIEGKKIEQNIQQSNIKELKISDKVANHLGIIVPKEFKSKAQ
jgi:putative ABC transport system substrate-binding protein